MSNITMSQPSATASLTEIFHEVSNVPITTTQGKHEIKHNIDTLFLKRMLMKGDEVQPDELELWKRIMRTIVDINTTEETSEKLKNIQKIVEEDANNRIDANVVQEFYDTARKLLKYLNDFVTNHALPDEEQKELQESLKTLNDIWDIVKLE